MAYNEPTFGESGEVYTDNVRNSLAHVKSAAEAAQATADNAVASIVTTSQTADEAKEIALAAQGYLETPTDDRVAGFVEDAASETRAALGGIYSQVGHDHPAYLGGVTPTAGDYAVAPMVGVTATRAMANQRLIASRFVLASAGTVDALAAGVASAATGGTGRIGLYGDDGGKPGALIVDGGTISLASATNQTVAISQALTPGVYWIGLLVENLSGSGTLRASNGCAFLVASNASTALTVDTNGYYSDGVAAGELPDPFPSPLGINTSLRLAARFA